MSEPIEKPRILLVDDKPENINSILDAVQGKVGSGRKRKDVSMDHKTDLSPLRVALILLAEDNEINQQVATHILAEAEIEVEIANNGEEAVAAVQKKRYDAVLMDIKMPRMDGYQATGAIRQNPKFADLPIIAMTANAMEGDRNKCIEAGMDDYVSKPIDPSKLFDTLLEWVDVSSKSDAKAEESSSTTEVKDAKPEGLPDSLPGFDIKTALARLGGSEDLFIRIAESFAESYRDADKQLTDLFEKEDYETAHREAHSIKGVVGNIGAMDLYEGAHELEAIAKKAEEGGGIDPSATQSAVEAFSSQLRVVIESLDSIIPKPDEGKTSEAAALGQVSLSKEQRQSLAGVIREACASGGFFALKSEIKDYPDFAEIKEVKDLIAKFDSDKLAELADRL